MVLISDCILELMRILEHDFSGHYNRLALISVDLLSGVYCTYNKRSTLLNEKLHTVYIVT